MKENLSQITNDLKEVIDPRQVEENIKSSWTDFWNLEVTKDASGDPVTLGVFIIAALCFIVGVVVAKLLSRRLVRFLFRRFQMSMGTLHLWSSITFYLFSLFATLIALKIAHVPLTIFTFLGGALALGVGFGSKNLVNNFISGLIFMFEAPAKVGDFLEVEGYFGRVIDVGVRATHIEIGMSKRAIIPNSSFVEKVVVNWGKGTSPVYLSVDVSVDYGADLNRVTKFLLQAPKDVEQVFSDLSPVVLVTNFAESGIDLRLSFPVMLRFPSDRDLLASEVRRRIDRIFTENRIAIPYPQLVLSQKAPNEKENPPS